MNEKNRCQRCNYLVTWAAMRVQYGRMMRRGFGEAVAKVASRYCQKCNTRRLREGSYRETQ